MEKLVNDIQTWLIRRNYHNESPRKEYFKLVDEFLKAEVAYRSGEKIELSDRMGEILFSMIILCTILNKDFYGLYNKGDRYPFQNFNCLFNLWSAIENIDNNMDAIFSVSLIELIRRVIQDYQLVMRESPSITPKTILLRTFNLKKKAEQQSNV